MMKNASKNNRLNPLINQEVTLAAVPINTAPKFKLKFKCLLATAITLALGINLPASAADFAVTVGNDDGTAGTANTLSWAILRANTTDGADTITVQTDVTITGVMKSLINSDVTLQNDGTARSISGGDQFRPLFIKSGNVTIQNLTLENGKAKGGGSKKGGGGAGLGGALFIYDGTVSVNNVSFENNNATGGSGDIGNLKYGGGGMFGNSGNSGGGGLFATSIDIQGAYGGNGEYNGFGGYGGGDAHNGSGDGGFGGGGGGKLGPNFGDNLGFGGNARLSHKNIS